MSLGNRIQQLRKVNGLSQEQLADNLGVSRQAISKWETDQSSPEIENILALSRVFSVTTDDLLGNEAINDSLDKAKSSTPKASGAMRDTKFTRRAKSVASLVDRKVVFVSFTFLCLIAIGVCIIVNFAIDQQITWASYPIISVALFWLIGIPLIFGKYTVALCVFTAMAAPFLYLMNMITPAPDWFSGLGIPITAISIVYIWIIYLLYRLIKISEWYKAAITLFLAGVVNVFIDCFTDDFLGTEQPLYITLITFLSILAVSVLLWVIGYLRNKAKSVDI